MSELLIQIPTPDAIEPQLGPIERNISAIEIVDARTHEQALELGKKLASVKRFVLDIFLEPKKKAHEAHKSITAAEARMILPIDRARSLLSAKLDAYELQERRRAEAEARERQLAAQKAEEDRQLEEAAAAEAAGDKELATAILEAPVVPATVIPELEMATVRGTSRREIWEGEVVNFRALVKSAAENLEHLAYLMPDQTAINGSARALKANMRVPGIRVTPKSSRSFRAD